MHHGHHDSHLEQFSYKPWYSKMKQKFIELSHDSRDKVADAGTAVKHYSDTVVQHIIDRPAPFLIGASVLGFLLASLLRHHKNH